MLNMLNKRFFNESLGVKLAVVMADGRKRKRGVAELAAQPWRLQCPKFRIPAFDDDGDPTKPLVRVRGPPTSMVDEEDDDASTAWLASFPTL